MDDDQEVYFETKTAGMTIRAASIAGSGEKPNEDAFAATKSLLGIFDGTTSAPIPALGKISSARYASNFLKDHFAKLPDTVTPKQAMLSLNNQLWETVKVFDGISVSDTLTLPASTATIIKFNEDTLSFAHIGDSFGIVYYRNGNSTLFTDDKNHRFDEQMFALIRDIAKTKKISNKAARKDPRVNEALYKMYYKRNNNPNGKGSGLINGDPHLELYIQTGEIPLENVQAILLGTDGLIPQGWSIHEEQDRQHLLKEIHEGGFKNLFETKHKSEDEDPEWNHIRYKHSDDATGVLITF